MVWLLVATIQALYFPLLADEAYYWEYSRQLAFGYFDHPPMIAWLIALGSSIYKSALTIRILPMVCVAMSILLLRTMVRISETSFWILIASIPLLQIMSCLALPDAPLLLTTVLYFLGLRLFIRTKNLKNSLILSLCIACMMYSKYHGILLIACTILAHPSLLKSKYFYASFAGSILLMSPHIYWQFVQDFPSFKYHLFERHEVSSKSNFLAFLASQLLVLGPLILIYFMGFKHINWTDIWERILHFCTMGVLLVFSINALTSWSESHWTLIIYIPILLALPERYTLPLWLKYGLVSWSICIVILRMVISLSLLPLDGLPSKLKAHYQKNQHWANTIQREASGRRPVFMNSYPDAALFNYYTDKQAYAWNDFYGRNNLYNIWLSNQNLQAENVFLIPYQGFISKEQYYYNGKAYPCIRYDEFKLFPSVQCEIIRGKVDKLNLDATIEVSGLTELALSTNQHSIVLISYDNEANILQSQEIQRLQDLHINKPLDCSLVLPEKTTKISLGIKQKSLPPSKRGRLYKLADFSR